MKRYEKFQWIFLIAVFFTGIGYMWRIYHETETHYELFEVGKRAMIREIAHEIPKGQTFHLEDIKFIPRRDSAVVIKRNKKEDNDKR